MSAADRHLVAALRAELAAIYPRRACDRAAERRGLEDALPQRDPVIARLSVRLERRLATEVASPGVDGSLPFDFASMPEHCRMAYLRGRFLARGSLSLSGGRTHLEFAVDGTEAPMLATWLSLADLPASWRIRRGRGVVTWKGAEMVGLFLRRIGANAALLELEVRQVARTLRGELNRVLNADSANLQRSVAAAGRQLAAIDQLEADGRLAEQPLIVRAVATARRTTPEATHPLGQLGQGCHREAHHAGGNPDRVVRADGGPPERRAACAGPAGTPRAARGDIARSSGMIR